MIDIFIFGLLLLLLRYTYYLSNQFPLPDFFATNLLNKYEVHLYKIDFNYFFSYIIISTLTFL